MAGGSAPRFAPDDPSLPPPWKALVDGNTGYIYYWNTDTNLTQYEKPSGIPPLPPGPPPAPSLPEIAPKQANVPVVTSSESKSLEKRGSKGAGGMSVTNNPGRIEEMRSVIAPTHVSSSGNRFSSSGGPLSTSHGNIQDNMYTNSSSSALNRSHVPEHQGRHSMDQHGRYASDHHSRSSSDHHGGHSAGRSISDHHGTQMPELRSRSILASQGGAMPNHHVPEHHGGHMPHQQARPPMLDRHGGHGGFAAPRSGHAVSGSGSRSSGHGMFGAGMHMNNSDSSWGTTTGRTSHGSPLAMKPTPSRSDYDGGGARNIPKLAALPIPPRQQSDMRGSHHSDQQRHIGHSSSGIVGRSSTATIPGASLKRPAVEHPPGGSEFQKRPRLQPFSETTMPPDVQAYQAQHEITVVGENVPPPFMTFDAVNFPPEIIKELRSAGFAAPTPIQAQSWPIALEKRDIVAIAKTGSGKTLGYLLPAFLHLLHIGANSRAGPVILVLAPTRELATQIQDEAVKFGRSSRISSTCVYGGAPKGPQIRDLERGADIVIATPGRLNDFLEAKKITLRQVSYLVLDEADRMLDMGFEPQIRKIVQGVPSSRQTLMFTATWPKEVRKIAADLLVNAVHVNIGNTDELTANKAITQHVEVVQPFQKQRRLEEILCDQEPGAKVIIFCSTKKMCDQLARSLARGFRAVAIHGDKSQSERDHVLAQFKAGRCPILVATDVAARGLDVKDIRVVINYDFPTGVEDYVHRIGRTGRAGATGEAFTFFSEQDSKFAKELVKILESADQKVPFELRQFAGRTGQSRGRSRWQTGGVVGSEESMNVRGGPRHRDVIIGTKDIRGGSYGYREGAVKNEAVGRWGFGDPGVADRDVGRDFGNDGRVGSIGGRGGGLSNRDLQIGSRVEGFGSKVVGVGFRGEAVSRRREDMNDAKGMRIGVASRESGKNVEGDCKDGWGDAGYNDGNDGLGASGNDGWGAPSIGSVGWGSSETAKQSNEHGGVSKVTWGDAGHGDGSGSSMVFGDRNSVRPGARQPEVRGRIFDRLGDRGRPGEKSGWKDHTSDGWSAEGGSLKKLHGAKEEIQRHGSFSPAQGWRESRSPMTCSTRGGSQTPIKDWGRSRSRSRSPGWGWSEMSPRRGSKNSPMQRGGWSEMSPRRGSKNSPMQGSPSWVKTDRSPIQVRHSQGVEEEFGSLAHGQRGPGKRPISSPTSLHSPERERGSSCFHQQPSKEWHNKRFEEHKDKLKASENKGEDKSLGFEGFNKERGNHSSPCQAVSLGSKKMDGSSTPESVIQDRNCQEAFSLPEGSEIARHSENHLPEDDPDLVNGASIEAAAIEIKMHRISSPGLFVDEKQLSDQTLFVKGLSPSKEEAFCEPPSSLNASMSMETPYVKDAVNDCNNVTGKPPLDHAAGLHADIVGEEMHQPTENQDLSDDKPGRAFHELGTGDSIDAVEQTEIPETAVSSPEEGMVL